MGAWLATWSGRDILDLLVRLSPAGTIIGALIAASISWRNQLRLNAITIAKNHYREMLELLLKNADLLPLASTPEALAKLRENPAQYERYIMLFAVVSFALQEVYFAMNPRKEKHWAEVIRMFMGIFRPLMGSEADFKSEMSQSVSPQFMQFVREVLHDPAPHISAALPSRGKTSSHL